MKGPHTTHLSLMPTGTHTVQAVADVHTHSLNPSALVAGLSEVSVISCPAWLNYDVNKSALVATSTQTSQVVRAHAHTQTQTPQPKSFSFFIYLILTS